MCVCVCVYLCVFVCVCVCICVYIYICLAIVPEYFGETLLPPALGLGSRKDNGGCDRHIQGNSQHPIPHSSFARLGPTQCHVQPLINTAFPQNIFVYLQKSPISTKRALFPVFSECSEHDQRALTCRHWWTLSLPDNGVCVCVYICADMCVGECVVYMCVCLYVCVCMCVCVCVCVRMCVCVNIYIHIYTLYVSQLSPNILSRTKTTSLAAANEHCIPAKQNLYTFKRALYSRKRALFSLFSEYFENQRGLTCRHWWTRVRERKYGDPTNSFICLVI